MKVERVGVIASCFALLSFAGCVATKPLAPKDDEGIVFFSVSHDLVGWYRVNASFRIDGGSEKGGVTVVSRPTDLLTGMSLPSDFKDSYGRVVAIALPPGKHRIDSWTVATAFSVIAPRELPEPLSFDVQPGQAKYLGNLHVHLGTRSGPDGWVVVNAALPEIRDERDRDIQIFETRHWPFKDAVTIEPLPAGAWIPESEWTTYLALVAGERISEPAADQPQAKDQPAKPPAPYHPSGSSRALHLPGKSGGKGAVIAVILLILATGVQQLIISAPHDPPPEPQSEPDKMQSSPSEDVVNCFSNGDRRWVPQSQCD